MVEKLIFAITGVVLVLPVLVLFVAKPGRSIIPLYAATLPIASTIDLPLPLPSPFDTLSSLLGAAAIGACLSHIAIYRRGSVPTIPVAVWLLLLAWTTITMLWADDALAAFRTVAVAVPLVLLMALVAALPRDEIDFDLLRRAVIFSGLVVGAYGLALLTIGGRLPAHAFGERFSIASDPAQTNPNILAATLLLPLTMSLERLFMADRGWKAFAAVATALTMFAIFLTASRGGLISAAIVGLLTLLLCLRAPDGRRRVRRVLAQTAVLFTASTLLLVIAVTLGPARIVERLHSRFIGAPIERLQQTQADSSGRLEIWQAGLVACKIHCALGAGAGNFPDIYNQVSAFSRADSYVGINRPAHNILLSMAVETGLLGFSLFALALVTEWISLSQPRMRALTPALRASLLGILVVNFFLSLLWYKYIWLVFMMIRAAEMSTSPWPLEEPRALRPAESAVRIAV